MSEQPKPVRIQRKRSKGFNLKELSKSINGLDVTCIGRPGEFGNPFVIGGYFKKGDFDKNYRGVFRMVWTQCLADYATPDYTLIETVEQSIEWFEWWLSASPQVTERKLKALRGKNVACWCGENSPCHGDVWLRLMSKEVTP